LKKLRKRELWPTKKLCLLLDENYEVIHEWVLVDLGASYIACETVARQRCWKVPKPLIHVFCSKRELTRSKYYALNSPPFSMLSFYKLLCSRKHKCLKASTLGAVASSESPRGVASLEGSPAAGLAACRPSVCKRVFLLTSFFTPSGAPLRVQNLQMYATLATSF
jgi:hypothetical protein